LYFCSIIESVQAPLNTPRSPLY